MRLPLSPRKDLEGAVLLYDDEHSFTVTSPDGTEYSHSE